MITALNSKVGLHVNEEPVCAYLEIDLTDSSYKRQRYKSPTVVETSSEDDGVLSRPPEHSLSSPFSSSINACLRITAVRECSYRPKPASVRSRTRFNELEDPTAPPMPPMKHPKRSRPSGPLAYLAFPLLLVIHLLFTLSSIALRIAELVSSASGSAQKEDDAAWSAGISGTRNSDTATNPAARRGEGKRPPKHVGLCLPVKGWGGGRVTSGGREQAQMQDQEKRVAAAELLLESIERCLVWAGGEGVPEFSVHSPRQYRPCFAKEVD